MAVVLDFPEQVYIDGTKFERKYVKNFTDAETRAVDLAKIALDSYPAWRDRTVAIQNGSSTRSGPAPPTRTTGPAPCA